MPRFCTAVEDNLPCGRRALPGRPFCAGHNPAWTLPGRCQYYNCFSEPCRSEAIRGHDYCFTHSPRNRRARSKPLPLVPRTAHQRRIVQHPLFNIPDFSRLPVSESDPPQPEPIQWVAGVQG
jgi:hypothetical protein